MRTVDDYAKYRTAHRDGMTIRQIARTFHVSRRKVREALASPEPKPYTRTKPPPAPVLGPFHAVIDHPPRRPRRPAQAAAHRHPGLPAAPGRARLPRRLHQVRRYVAAHRRRSRRRRSSRWPTRRAAAWRPTSGTSTSTSPTAAAWSPSW